MKNQIKISLVILIGLSFVLLSPFFVGDKKLSQANAQNEISTGQLLEGLIVPGRIQGVGKFFEIKNSRYLDVFLSSEEEVRVFLESIPKIINLNIEAMASSSASTDLKIAGLQPNKVYFKYQDSYKNRIAFISDERGALGWTQDLAAPHHVWLQETESTTYIEQDTTLDGDIEGSVEISASNVTLNCQGHQIIGNNNGFGIYLNNKTGVTIQNCLIRNFIVGIYVIGNFSSNNNILANDVFNNEYGIELIADYWRLSYGNHIAENKIYSNYWGMEINGHSFNSITGNNIFNNSEIGFLLNWAPSNQLRNNIISSNKYNFGVYGGWVNAPQDIDTSNTVNGKPIYYLVDQENKTVDASSDPGYVGVVNSKNITIKDVALSGNIQGIYLEGVSDSLIDNVKVSSNRIGIEMNLCSQNQIISSAISENNYRAGIVLWLSSNNIIADNDISSNMNLGVNLTGTWDSFSHDNKVYHNNFKNNGTNIDANRSYGDVFDDGYPSGGNYYSDYAGADIMSGPLQDQLGADGIGDTPYYFFPGVTYLGHDRYPLMEPVEINPPQKWSFAIISDLHVGQPALDYSDATWNDGVSGEDDIVSVKNLKNIIDLINLNIENYDLKFVVVDGDFTDSAELSELHKANEILNNLSVPWIPLMGNHDVWPYTRFPFSRADETDIDKNGADKFFFDILNYQYGELRTNFSNWRKEDSAIWNPETDPNHYSYFQNFSFDYNDYHFLGLDFNFRDGGLLWPWGVYPKGNLHNFVGGTWKWLETDLELYVNSNSDKKENIILLAHHPFRKWKEKLISMGFSDDELHMVDNLLEQYKDNIWGEFAGHSHDNKVNSRADGAAEIIETAANVSNPLARIVQVYPNGDINYSEMLGYGMIIVAHSPVDLEVTDPLGSKIDKQSQVSGISYTEEDIDGDGDLDDLIKIEEREVGDYQIKVIREPGATDGGTYSLEVSTLEDTYGYTPLLSVENIPISQIPSEPYTIEIKEREATNLVYDGEINSQYSDSVNLNAVLTDVNGNPVANKNIVFELGEQSISVATNSNGVANTSLIMNQIPSKDYLIEASFVGDEDYLPSSDSKDFEILKENIVINILVKEGFAFDETVLEAEVEDEDGQVPLPGFEVEFKIDSRVVGVVQINVSGVATSSWRVDIIPKEITERHLIEAVFGGDDYYESAQGESDFVLKSAKWLKQNVVSKLDSIETDDRKLKLEIQAAKKLIQDSLTKNLWLNASRLIFFEGDCFKKSQSEIEPEKIDAEKLFETGKTNGIGKNCSWLKSGLRVFGDEYLAVKILQKKILNKPKISPELKDAFNQIIGELVKADELLAQVAIYDAQNTTVNGVKFQELVDKQVAKAVERLAKAQELSENQPNKAIANFTISWLHAQLAVKFANL